MNVNLAKVRLKTLKQDMARDKGKEMLKDSGHAAGAVSDRKHGSMKHV